MFCLAIPTYSHGDISNITQILSNTLLNCTRRWTNKLNKGKQVWQILTYKILMNVIYTSVTSKNNYLQTEMKILMKKKKIVIINYTIATSVLIK